MEPIEIIIESLTRILIYFLSFIYNLYAKFVNSSINNIVNISEYMNISEYLIITINGDQSKFTDTFATLNFSGLLYVASI